MEYLGYSVPAVIIGLVALAKGLGMESRYAPLLSVLIGIGFSLLASGLSVEGIVGGLVLGLSASGLYDIGKKTILGA